MHDLLIIYFLLEFQCAHMARGKGIFPEEHRRVHEYSHIRRHQYRDHTVHVHPHPFEI